MLSRRVDAVVHQPADGQQLRIVERRGGQQNARARRGRLGSLGFMSRTD